MTIEPFVICTSISETCLSLFSIVYPRVISYPSLFLLSPSPPLILCRVQDLILLPPTTTTTMTTKRSHLALHILSYNPPSSHHDPIIPPSSHYLLLEPGLYHRRHIHEASTNAAPRNNVEQQRQASQAEGTDDPCDAMSLRPSHTELVLDSHLYITVGHHLRVRSRDHLPSMLLRVHPRRRQD